ncbi:hypothetical protein H5410_000244 [Solanum commersonii]|uniref:Uncharacterized protein n=1 Tax=Solanum commersonii TaxID=4109 RepID=A0A9J6AWN0_SOLCO|nr:hypothetical protein H5410_000244 [Solanum commersonii]
MKWRLASNVLCDKNVSPSPKGKVLASQEFIRSVDDECSRDEDAKKDVWHTRRYEIRIEDVRGKERVA